MAGIYTAIAASAAVGFVGSQMAADKQVGAENNAMNTQYGMFQQQQANQAPYLAAGKQALSQIQQNMPQWNHNFNQQDFQSNLNPGYQFQLNQGLGAIGQNSAATGSSAIGTGQLQGINNYAQNFANTSYQSAFNNYQSQVNNQFNRLSSVAGLGQVGAQNTNQGAMNAGNQIGQSLQGIGNAQASKLRSL